MTEVGWGENGKVKRTRIRQTAGGKSKIPHGGNPKQREDSSAHTNALHSKHKKKTERHEQEVRQPTKKTNKKIALHFDTFVIYINSPVYRLDSQ